MRALFHPEREAIQLTSILYALSDPTRLSIVHGLAERGEQPCGPFCAATAKSTMSYHFKVLRETGVLRMRAEGTSYRNSLRREDLDARFPGLLDAVLNACKSQPQFNFEF